MRKMQYNSFSKYEKISDSLLEKHINSKLNRTLTSSEVLRLDNEEIKKIFIISCIIQNLLLILPPE